MPHEDESPVHEKEPLLSETEREDLHALEEPITKIINELRPQIETGQYKIILGDDASGRIPTLIMGRIIQKLYEAKGYPPPLIRFIAGSTKLYDEEMEQEKLEEVEKHLRRIKSEIYGKSSEPEPSKTSFWGRLAPRSVRYRTQEKRKPTPSVLIVTDTIASGRSVDMLSRGLKKNALRGDIASIGIVFDSEDKKGLEKKFGGRIIGGMWDVPSIYGKHKLSGVNKAPRELFARPMVKDPDFTEPIQQKINESRKVANDIADTIAKKIMQQ